MLDLLGLLLGFALQSSLSVGLVLVLRAPTEGRWPTLGSIMIKIPTCTPGVLGLLRNLPVRPLVTSLRVKAGQLYNAPGLRPFAHSSLSISRFVLGDCPVTTFLYQLVKVLLFLLFVGWCSYYTLTFLKVLPLELCSVVTYLSVQTLVAGLCISGLRVSFSWSLQTR